MQVTETVSEGLKRELKVVVEAKELDDKLSTRLEDLKDRVRLKGFRPGKVPVAHLRRVYGRSVMAEIIEETLRETVRNALEERDERPAYEPELSMTEDEKEVEEILEGKADLLFSMTFEVIPPFELTDLKSLEIEKEVAEVTDEQIEEGLNRLAENNVAYTAKEGPAEIGDQVTIDFVGKLDGVEFDGGKAEDAPVVIGQSGYIPGFEEGLIGVKAGEEKDLNVTFPEEYGVEHLAGQDAVFEVKVKQVAAPSTPEIDDKFAETLGMENLDKLKEGISGQLAENHKDASRAKLKQKIFDALEEKHDFELPSTLVEKEFDGLWNQLKANMERQQTTFEKEETTEEEQRDKYKKYAESSVRLGLIVNEIGSKNEITVSEDEIKQAMFERIQQYPEQGQREQMLNIFKERPEALEQIRLQLFEDKVVDFIAAMAKVSEKTVSAEELHKHGHDDEDHVCDENCDHDH